MGKSAIVIGGFLGFMLCFTTSFIAGNDFSGVLMVASVGCVVGATLMKGFQKVIMENLQASKSQKFEKAEPTEAENKEEEIKKLKRK